MTTYKHVLCILLLAATCLSVEAQTNGSNSPYSRFGLGTLNEQSQSANRGMGGIGFGLRSGDRINMLNPASYSAVDSLSFLFDVGMSLRHGTLKNGSKSSTVNNTTLDFVNAAFRIRRGWGMSLGFVPYSTIGYSFTQEQPVGTSFPAGNQILSTTSYNGDGGIHQMYVGMGWSPFRQLSIGANISYLWGNYDHTVNQKFSEGGTVSSAYNGLNVQYEANIKTYKLDIGAQYTQPIGKQDLLTVGVVVGIGHPVNNTARLYHFASNGDTIPRQVTKAFELPYTFGGGLAWQHKQQWLVGVDVNHERWGNCRMPQTIYSDESATTLRYESVNNAFQNRTRVAAGAEYVPNRNSRRYLRRVQYRIGASYAGSYVHVNGGDGPRTYSVSAGFGFPISNKISSRSVVNVSFQWEKVDPVQPNQISENYFKVNLGIVFNERWFMKWKIN